VADVVCLRGLRCRRNSARRAARLRSSAALLHGGLGRAGARAPGARCSSTAAKARSAEVRAPVFAVAVTAPQRRVGDADASAEERPGAALARADAGSRSAAREHRRRVRRRVRESRCQALQRPRGARTARPRRCPPNSVRRQGSPQRAISEAEAMPRRRAGPARSEAERFMSAGASPMAIGLRGATRRVPEGGPRRGPWHAPCGAPVPFLAPRAGADVGASVPRRPQAPCGAPLRRAPRGRVRHDLAEREEREHDQGDDAEDEHRKGAAFGSGRRGGRAAASHGSRRRGPPPLAVTHREAPARRVPAAEGGLRATPHRGRSQAKRAWPDAVPLCPSRRCREGAPTPPYGAASGPAAEQVAAAPKAS
jgi:hypothetical protein